MSSTNKTPFMKLNSWIGSDIPCRADFVRDNNLIDKTMQDHSNNNNIHTSLTEKMKWDNPHYIFRYGGDGNSSQTITMDCKFTPHSGIVYALEYPTHSCDYSNKTTYHYLGFFSVWGKNSGIDIKGKNLTVKNTYSRDFPTEVFKFNILGVFYEVIVLS